MMTRLLERQTQSLQQSMAASFAEAIRQLSHFPVGGAAQTTNAHTIAPVPSQQDGGGGDPAASRCHTRPPAPLAASGGGEAYTRPGLALPTR